MDNPFNALISDNNESNVGQSVDQLSDNIDKKAKLDLNYSSKDIKINDFLVSMFGFRVNKLDSKTINDSNIVLKVVSLIDENKDILLSFDNLDQFLCERLMLSDVNQCLIEYRIDKQLINNQFSVNTCEQRVLYYLYECYLKIETIDSMVISTQQKIRLRDIVVNQSSLIVCHPEFDPNLDQRQKVSQLLEVLEDFDSDLDNKRHLQSFICRVFERIQAKVKSGDEDMTPTQALKTTYDALSQRLTRMSLIDPILSRSVNTLSYLVLNPILCKALIELNEPNVSQSQPFIHFVTNPFQNTLFGLLLSISCLPRPNHNKMEFFLNPSNYSQQEHEVTERNLSLQINRLTETLHSIIYSLLKQKESKDLTIDWIERCLHSFKDRAKMWTNEMIRMTGSAQNSSDGFMINMSSVLLRLCKPFCIPMTHKLLKVDARYCRLKHFGNKTYLEAIASEPFLTPSDTDQINENEFNPNFMTQCFIATHKALHLGFRVVHERFLKLVQDLNQIQTLYREASLQSTDSEAAQVLRQRMDRNMTQYLALKAMLSENQLMEMSLNFHISTAIWLNNLAINCNEMEASKAFKSITLPIPINESQCLKSIPEFIVENVSDFVIFVRRFNEKTFALPNIDLKPLMSMIIIFMGSPERMKNPHLRAKLAEMLESLMPSLHSESSMFSISANTETLFTNHPLIDQLMATLIHVFVSIEISESSGESVAFEQKFSYRRPMYIVMKYLWSNVEHRKRMKELADFAENNMEAIVPPLFLRFINLLMNDAIFLLDEALTHMNQLRELVHQRDSGQWDQLAAQQRQQNETNLQHTGRLAKFHNIIGRDTINTLSYLTEQIKTIFSHKTLVDRMAAMLNYFLLHLVGPQKRNFKVKDLNQYEFKPADIVTDICRIYVNLSAKDNQKYKQFCLAVGLDDRSYSSSLLPLASDVLIKTGALGLSTQTLRIGQQIENLLQYHRSREINVNEVPEEFLDPIMSSIMEDPVLLPNSGVIVDRSTIARHLLSDQTDPFTRSPLTMDLVVTDNDLKHRIKAFIEDKLKTRDENNV